MSSIIRHIYSISWRGRRKLPFEQVVLPHKIGELSARGHAQLHEDVRQMRADRPRGDLERASDFLVGFPAGNHARNLDFPPSQTRRTAGDGFGRRSHAAIAHLFAGLHQFIRGAEASQHVVGAPQFPRPSPPPPPPPAFGGPPPPGAQTESPPAALPLTEEARLRPRDSRRETTSAVHHRHPRRRGRADDSVCWHPFAFSPSASRRDRNHAQARPLHPPPAGATAATTRSEERRVG